MKHGKRQTLETLINEEALLLAKYLRNETARAGARMRMDIYSFRTSVL